MSRFFFNRFASAGSTTQNRRESEADHVGNIVMRGIQLDVELLIPHILKADTKEGVFTRTSRIEALVDGLWNAYCEGKNKHIEAVFSGFSTHAPEKLKDWPVRYVLEQCGATGFTLSEVLRLFSGSACKNILGPLQAEYEERANKNMKFDDYALSIAEARVSLAYEVRGVRHVVRSALSARVVH